MGFVLWSKHGFVLIRFVLTDQYYDFLYSGLNSYFNEQVASFHALAEQYSLSYVPYFSDSLLPFRIPNLPKILYKNNHIKYYNEHLFLV